MCGVIFTLSVGCSRPLSAANDLTATIKNLESRTFEGLSKDGKQRVHPFYHVALHVCSFVDFDLNLS